MWRWRWPILVLAVVAGAAAGLATQQGPLQWQGSFVVDILPDKQSPDALRIAEARYIDLTKSSAVVADATRRAQVARGASEVAKSIAALDSNNVGLLRVSVSAASATEATNLAGSLAAASLAASQAQRDRELAAALQPVRTEVASVQQQLATTPSGSVRDALQTRYQSLLALEQQIMQTQSTNSVSLQYVASTVRTGSTRARTVAVLGFLVAIVVNGELSALFTMLRNRFTPGREREELAALVGLPVLAELAPGHQGELEGFGELRAVLKRAIAEMRVRRIAFISTGPVLGPAWLVHEVANTLADAARVVLIDLTPGVGVPADLKAERKQNDLDAGIAPVPGDRAAPSVRIIRPLTQWANTSAEANLARVRSVMKNASVADFIVLNVSDAEPAVPAVLLAAECDATVLVVQTRNSRRRSVKEVSTRLLRTGANVVGLVADNRRRSIAETAKNGFSQISPAREGALAATQSTSGSVDNFVERA